MEIHQLEMLRELGALGSVKAVAETLLVTPSAVSQQLAALQRSVEVPLTRKEGRNLVLTEAGQVLADAGAAVVSAMADARMAIGAYHGSTVAPVTVSGFHSAGQALFAPLARLLDSPGQAAGAALRRGRGPAGLPRADRPLRPGAGAPDGPQPALAGGTRGRHPARARAAGRGAVRPGTGWRARKR